MKYPSPPLISTKQLDALLDDKNLRIIDASWHLPTSKRDAKAEYLSQHIKGAAYFNLDQIADLSSDFPHMVASAKDFSNAVFKMGISPKNIIVIYDSIGLFSAARVWWNFKIMGAKNVYVLNGGLPKWIEDGYKTDNISTKYSATEFIANPNNDAVINAEKILSIINNNHPNGEQIIDVRPAARFLGKAPEPRAGLRSGHIPNSKNIPFSELVKNGQLISPQEIKQKFLEQKIDLAKPIISTCGSGVTAPIINLALATINIDCLNVFDGSWALWGADDRLPIATK